jgi:DNA-binding response OmpR family regulator
MQPAGFSIQHILLVDDDTDEYDIFSAALKQVNTDTKLSFLDNTNDLTSALNELEPDLIFLDINMPGKSGFQALQEIFEWTLINNVPVIMYSNSVNQADVDLAYRFGATLYFKKATSLSELVRSLKKILSMPWNEPSVIANQHFRNGRFRTFTL